MNIVILIDRYFPTPVSGAVLIKDLAIELRQLGHEVFILTGDSTIQGDSEIIIDDDINVYKVKVPDQKSLSLPRRLLFELFLQRRIWKFFASEIKLLKIDLVIVHSPTIFWSYLLKKIRIYQNPLVYLVLRDIFPRWVVETKLISIFNPVYWFLKRHEKKLYKEADVIGVQSNSNLNHFNNKSYRGSYKLEVLFNWKQIIPHKLEKWNLREKFNLQNKVIYVFGGNIGFAQDVDNLLRLVSTFKNEKKIHFLFIGEGTEYTRIEKWLKNQGPEANLTLLPAVSNDEYQSILQECDVGIISLRKDFKTDNIPNKILNYLDFQLPILASINPDNDIRSLIESFECGLVSENGQNQIFISHARELLANKSKREEMGANGYGLLQEVFDVKSAVKQVLKHGQKTNA